MNDLLSLDRRRFLKHSAVAAGGLVIGFSMPGAIGRALAEPPPVAGKAVLPPLNAFLRIGADDSISLTLARVEMGQGAWTLQPMLMAEELDADWSKIRVEHTDVVSPIYVNTKFGFQGTGGSTSTMSEFDRYRQVGALARALLLQAAAQRFHVPIESLRTDKGAVLVNGRRVSYGELAEAAAKLPQPATVELKKPQQWTIIGKPTKRLDSPEKITGQAKFGMDTRFPGLLIAVVARAPAFGATLKSFDANRAKAIPGVRHVVQVSSGVAVVADHFWAAKQGRDALLVEWDLGPHAAGLDDAVLRRGLLQRVEGGNGAVARTAGRVDDKLGQAKQIIEADYWVPYVAHAPMEPQNCTVRIDGDKCDIWIGTQMQDGEQKAAAAVLGFKPEQVAVHTPFLGGGFGRRGEIGARTTIEAVEVAKAVGAPVKTVWTREDDTRGGHYRPMYLHRARIGLDGDGAPMAWRHTVAGQSLAQGTFLASFMVKNGIDSTSVEGIVDSPYLEEIGDHHIGLHTTNPGVPVLFWRSVGHSHTGFVMESLIDELAHAAGQDPLAYRRKLLAKHPRHLGVLNLAAEKAGWGSPLPPGHARGIAVHASFDSYAAQVAEVSVEHGAIRVHRMVCAFDGGIVVNPAGIEAQMESAVAFGLSATLHSKLSFKEGRLQESNFHDFRILRVNEMPRVETYIVSSLEPAGGAGEPGVPPVASAVANAVFALTGQRLRELPLRLVSQSA